MKNLLIRIGKKSKKAFADQINTKKKNKVLKDFSKLIRQNKNKIIHENKKDIENSIKKGLKQNLIERLELNEKKF